MSPKIKNKIIYSVMAIVIALFIFAIFVGNHAKQQEAEGKSEAYQPEQDEQSQAVRQYSAEAEQTHENKEANNEPISEQHRKLDIEIPKAEMLEKSEGKYDDYFSREEIEKSRETARLFTKNFYELNGEELMSHVKNAEPYMTANMYQTLIEQTPRPTAAVYNKEVESLDVYEPYDLSKEQLIWKVHVKGNVYDKKGNKTADERKDFTIKTTKVEGTFKVENYMLNVPF
ncbi:hypothetical protein [Lentibacillus amyloliquefaciens]|uniref:Uncharacterized protein n=1 Tax=Lentibacillus amyloliquefaciens TaxID=1472767 RepID=A0A0U3W3H0_9BACI|nr:hypothetical protein [Lentibacillus amyloliquefaciens]ALX47712.1 hypothetical protein AOX59_03290 [Lentibacillus amyloliquefaciens]